MLLPCLFQLGECLQRLGCLFRFHRRRVIGWFLDRTAHRRCRCLRCALGRCDEDTILLRCRALANPRACAGWRLPVPTPLATWHREELLEEGIKGWKISVRFNQRGA